MSHSPSTAPQPRLVVTIGSFDGVHLGHRHIIRQVVDEARRRGAESCVVTFSNHPMQVLRHTFTPQMLSPGDEKLELLRETGVDHVELLKFTPELSQMSACDFMREVLARRLGAEALYVGYDNRLGRDRKGFDECAEIGRQLGIEVLRCEEWTDPRRTNEDDASEVSSTSIRNALLAGQVTAANRMLGYPYALRGTVVEGFQNGRKLGFPTANLKTDPNKLLPQNGVYLVSAGERYGMLNIGCRPTLHNGRQRSVEAHLFDFDGDLYGQTLSVRLIRHLRPERQFDTLEQLQRQLDNDRRLCLQILENPHCP